MTEFLEDLLQPGNLSFGFMQIIAKAGSEFAIGRLLDQLWKRPYDLVFGVEISRSVCRKRSSMDLMSLLKRPILFLRDQVDDSCGATW